MKRIFRIENKPEADVDDLLVYTMIGTVSGARLGHILFYSPGYYFSNPLEILKVCQVEPNITTLNAFDLFQFERLGYFCIDPDTTNDHLIINRSVELRGDWKKYSGKKT